MKKIDKDSITFKKMMALARYVSGEKIIGILGLDLSWAAVCRHTKLVKKEPLPYAFISEISLLAAGWEKDAREYSNTGLFEAIYRHKETGFEVPDNGGLFTIGDLLEAKRKGATT